MSIAYVLTNPAMPSLVKIGCTENEDAITRIAAVYSTGVPVPFTIEFAAKVADPYRVEEALRIASRPTESIRSASSFGSSRIKQSQY